MGVPDLWDVVQPAIYPRMPLSVLSSQFQAKTGRPMRVAIDSYIWLFETGHDPMKLQRQDEVVGADLSAMNPYKMIQGFISRITQLIICNISFVIVFDGDLKPSFKKRIRPPSELSAEEKSRMREDDFENFKSLYQMIEQEDGLVNDELFEKFDNELDEVKLVKKALSLMGISYLDASGEAECECARLQNIGVVDFVITNDSDVILFGATRILKSFGKVFEQRDQDEFYIDPVYMDEFYDKNEIDRSRLIFFAILRGADYNLGFNGIGTERARRIAFVGTRLNKAHEDCIDFHHEFKSIFYSGDHGSSANNTATYFKDFLRRLQEEILENAPMYFGRKDKVIFKDLPPQYIALLYYYPVLRKKVYCFHPGTLNYQETAANHDFHLGRYTMPHFRATLTSLPRTFGDSSKKDGEWKIHIKALISKTDAKLPNVSNVESYLVSHLSKWVLIKYLIRHEKDSATPLVPYIGSFKVKKLPSRNTVHYTMKNSEQSLPQFSSSWESEVYMIKFNAAAVLSPFVEKFEKIPLKDEDFESSLWVNKEVMLCHKLERLIGDFEKNCSLSRQSSTLDQLMFNKGINYTEKTHTYFSKSPNKVVKLSPKKPSGRSPRKSPRKSTVLGKGQKPITSFFEQRGVARPDIQKDNERILIADVELEEEEFEEEEEVPSLPRIHSVLDSPTKKPLNSSSDIEELQSVIEIFNDPDFSFEENNSERAKKVIQESVDEHEDDHVDEIVDLQSVPRVNTVVRKLFMDIDSP